MNTRFPWLAMPALAALLALLNREGEEARVVGGAVRNALLSEEVAEWDIATTARPEIVVERVRASGWKPVPTGIAHGTVTVIIEGHPFEVTTLREDVETDGRHAVVQFGRDFRADAFRRDFTINAMSLSRDGVLHDYADGLLDIEARRVRFIGDPDRRIAEDYLRILRLFRFHARYASGPIDPASLAAAIRGREGLRQLSAERVHAELLKLVLAAEAGSVLTQIDGAGFLLLVLGGIARVPAFRRLVDLEAQFGFAPDPIRRLGALALFTQADAGRLATRLRLSNAQTRKLASIAAIIERVREAPTEAIAREWLYRLGNSAVQDGMLVAAAFAPQEDFSTALHLATSWTVPKNPFRGSDPALRGIEPGQRMGHILAEAERRWIEAGFPEGREARHAILAAAARSIE